MRLLKDALKRIILIIVLISILITFLATPAAYAKLDLEEGEFYYSGTTKGTYVPSTSIFDWLINALAQVADFILGILSLIIRMPFIGWTALFEKMLTWALESTMGVSADGSMVGTSVNEDGELEIDSGDLTGLTDSSNNVTVEAIVYNRVAALDVDIFDLEFDRTLSATGQKLVCKKCEKKDSQSGSGQTEYTAKYVEDCLAGKLDAINAAAETIREKRLAGEEVESLKIEDYCECDCNGCDACQFYLAQIEQNEPLIFKLKQLVATWYSIIRYLAIAAMLLVLIGIGIKMAISTIASDKAVYKRMLVDWCVGFIMLFAIHYFMMFVIQVNEVLVNTIADSAQSINKVQMTQLGLDEAEFTDSELELKVYEEVRTRAYDAKLSNGMIGMVMYMTLVYLAFRYTIIYLKRFLTIIVLTLMAPAIGVAYALQKALSGKSAALKTWMTEYIMNIIIQSVHALIYAIFISQALIMSLQNVAGMIMALILMNYTSKADELFKKIFKFGGGDSLLGHTEGAADSFKQNMDAALGFAAGAKPMAKALTNTPYGKAVKGVGKALVAGGVAGIGLARNGLRAWAGVNDQEEQIEDETSPENLDGNETGEGGNNGQPNPGTPKQPQLKAGELTDAKLRELGGAELKYQMDTAKHAMKAEKNNPNEEEKKKKKEDYEAKRRNYNRFRELAAPTKKQIAAGHFDRLISMENVFTTGKPTGKFAGLKTAWVAAMGTSHYDKKQGKWVNDGNSVFDQLRASEILGLTDQDKKVLKEFGGDMMKGLMGMGSLFLGMGTIVANPKVGMGLLANGIASTNKVFGRDTNLARTPAKYKFGRFSPQSIDSIRNSAIAKAQAEHDEILAEDLRRRHPQLVKKIKDGVISGATVAGIESGALLLTGSAGLAATALLPTAAVVGGASMFGTKLMRNTAIAGKLADIDKHHTKQQKELIEKFNKEADKEMLNSSKAEAEYSTERFMGYLEGEYLAGKIGDREKTLQDAVDQSNYNEAEQTIEMKTVAVEDDEIKLTKKAKLKGFDSSTIATALDKELDRVIAEMTAGGTIDITSRAVQIDIMNRLGLGLEQMKILEKGEQAFRLLDGGEAALVRKLKVKAAVRNEAVTKAQKELEEALKPEEAKEVQTIIDTMLQETVQDSADEDSAPLTLDRISVYDVMERMQPSQQDGFRPVNQNDGSQQVVNPDVSGQPQEIDPAKKQAIEKYLKAVKETRVTEAVTIKGEVTQEAVQEVKGKADRTRKKEVVNSTQKKLQQVLSLAIEDESLIEEVDVNGRKVVQIKGTVSKDGTVQLGTDVLSEEDGTLSAREYSYVNETVKSLLDMKRLNEKVLVRDTEMKKDGSVAYLERMKENSVDMIGIAENRKKEISLELEKSSGVSQERIAQIDQTIADLQQNTQDRQTRIDAKRESLSVVGPIQDVNAYINKSLFKTKGRKVR